MHHILLPSIPTLFSCWDSWDTRDKMATSLAIAGFELSQEIGTLAFLAGTLWDTLSHVHGLPAAWSPTTVSTMAKPMQARCFDCPKSAAVPASGSACWQVTPGRRRGRALAAGQGCRGLARISRCRQRGRRRAALEHGQFGLVFVLSIDEACHKATTAPA